MKMFKKLKNLKSVHNVLNLKIVHNVKNIQIVYNVYVKRKIANYVFFSVEHNLSDD